MADGRGRLSTTRARTSVRVSRACYGTLSNGSDVRLLVSPSNMALTGAMKGTLEAFFYAAWKGVAQRTDPYFALIPLEDDLSWWGLMRVTRGGRGAAGEVAAAWCALMDERALDSILWSTHRMLASAFPPPGANPPAGTRAPPEEVNLMEGQPPTVARFVGAFDQVLAKTRNFTQAAAILVERPHDPAVAPLSAEGALFGLWDLIGADRRNLAWTTWAGVETHGFVPKEPFDVVFSEDVAPAPREGRLSLRLGRDPAGDAASPAPRPARAWRALEMETAPAPVPEDLALLDSEAAPEDGRQLARLIFERSPDDFTAGRNLSIFGRIAGLGLDPQRQAPGFLSLYRAALPALLQQVVEAAGDPAIAANVVDAYVHELRARLPHDADASAEAAGVASRAGVLARLGGEAVAWIGPAIVADGELRRMAVDQLREGDPRQIPWPAWLPIADQGLDADTDLAKAAGAGAWSRPDLWSAAAGLLARLAQRHGLAAVIPLLGPVWRPKTGVKELFRTVHNLRPRNQTPDPKNWLHSRFRLLNTGVSLKGRP